MKIEPRYYLSTGKKLLWQNRKRLLVPAVLSFVVTILISIDSWLPLNKEPVGIINDIGYILLTLGGFYFAILTYIAVFLAAKECLDSESSSLLELYKKSTKYVRLNFLYGLLYLIVAFPLLLAFKGMISVAPYDFAKLCILLIGLLISLGIFSVLCLTEVSVIIDFQSKKHLRRCIKMIMSNFVPVMMILIISYSLVMIPLYLFLLQPIELSRFSLMIKDIIIALVELFLVPYVAFVQILLYRDLKDWINSADSNQHHMGNEQI